MRLKTKAGVLSVAAATTLLAGVALAAPASAYVAGTATVSAITYNATTGSMNWHCSFSNWAGAGKTWRCDQWNEAREYVVRPHSGSWSGSSLTTGTYANPDNINPAAYKAYAIYNDGSSSATQWRWG